MEGRICKRFTFDAAHKLPNHDGKCRNLHGHTYLVEVEFTGELVAGGPKEGMVVDYGDIKDVWKVACEPLLDHRYLNETLADDIPVTTAEWIAVWIHRRFTAYSLEPAAVRVWETPTSWAQHP